MKKINLILCFAIFLVNLPVLLLAQDISTKADSLLNRYYQHDLFTGTVLIAKDNKIIFERSYGMADRLNKIHNSAQTEYRIGSISKPITATLILQQIEKGNLSLEEKLSKFLPGLRFSDSVTIRQMLSHTSGIKSLTSTKEYYTNRLSIHGEKEVVDILKNFPLEFTPGTRYQYSNSNYILLGYILEKITGKSLPLQLAQFTAKAGMKNTSLDYDGRLSNKKAVGYEEAAMEDYQPIKDMNIGVVGAAGGFFSTVRDLYKFNLALNSNKLLTKETMDLMYTQVKPGYGLGWGIDTYEGQLEVSHSGSIEGFKSMIMRYPESGTCIIFLSNYFNTRGQEICDQLKAITFNKPLTPVTFHQFIELPRTELEKFEGEYHFNENMTMQIKMAEGRLVSIIKGQPEVSFRPTANMVFYNKSNNAVINFMADGQGKINVLKLQKGKQQMEWKKL